MIRNVFTNSAAQVALLLALCLLALAPAAAAEKDEQAKPTDDAQKEVAADMQEAVATHHVLRAEGKRYPYVARAGEMEVASKEGATEGSVFYVAYELEGVQADSRPVTFAFNGGPGASAVWLHMGAMGPERVALGEHGELPRPPVGYEENPLSWLRFSDLVFVDPVGTGFSRAPKKDKKDSDGTFWGVEQDVAHMSAFIRLYLSRNERWTSPVFLVGESYGTTRAAALSRELLDGEGIAVNGLVLVSPVLDFATLLGGETNLPYALFLPSYAATARFHGKLGEQRQQLPLQELLEEAQTFVADTYLAALFKGGALDEQQRQELYHRVAGFTGLPEELVARNDGRIAPHVFFKHLLQQERLLVGRMDGTVTGMDPDPGGAYSAFDPSLDGLLPAFASSFNSYVRQELEYESDLVYEILNPEVERSWDWSSGVEGRQGYVNMADEVREAMSINPAMHVWFAGGYYDLATPYYASIYTVRQMRLAPQQRKKLRMDFYHGGHMLYSHREAREHFFKDAEAFYDQALQ